VLVPEALAYASIAGVSPVIGLYTAPAALVLYAALGTSRHLVVGPMSATAALSAATIADFATPGSDRFTELTVTLALATGVIAFLAGLLRLGFLANYISEPVLKGFIVGLALTIMVGQLPKLFGVSKGSGDFFQRSGTCSASSATRAGATLLVGLASLAIVLGLRRIAPIVPASLVAFGVVVVKLFDPQQHDVEIVVHIDSGLPSFGLPTVHSGGLFVLSSAGAGVMLTGFAEGLGAAKTYAAANHYTVDANGISAVMELVDIPRAPPPLPHLHRPHRKTARDHGPPRLRRRGRRDAPPRLRHLPGHVIGIAASLLLLLYRASYPHVAELGAAPTRTPVHRHATPPRQHKGASNNSPSTSPATASSSPSPATSAASATSSPAPKPQTPWSPSIRPSKRPSTKSATTAELRAPRSSRTEPTIDTPASARHPTLDVTAQHHPRAL
jgi:hypothetical protein